VLGQTKNSDAALEHFVRMPSLKSIVLGNGTDTTDAGIQELAKLSNLEEVAVAFNPLTDACIESLLTRHNWRRLYLYGTKITQAGFNRLREALPNCSVEGEPVVKSA
jgi:hypothetical protein